MGLRERTRQVVRTDIAAVAMRLFVAQGFDATTMDQIATEAGISRRSLFRYFHGRSSLGTWLRAVLSQRYVDGLRRARRLEPLPTDEEAEAVRSEQNASPPEQARFVDAIQHALTAAVARLEPRDRLRLACYYAQNLTLAQIGRTLREHEATTSRNLARTRRAIREDVEQQLRHTGMSEAEVAECFATVSADAGPLDLKEILPEERR